MLATKLNIGGEIAALQLSRQRPIFYVANSPDTVHIRTGWM